MDQPRPSYWLLENKAYSDDGTKYSYRNHNVGKEKANNLRSRWPQALNVVTNFSKAPQSAQRSGDKKKWIEENAVAAFRSGHRRLNSSADIKTPDTYRGSNNQSEQSRRDKKDPTCDKALGPNVHEFEITREAPSPPRDNKGPVNDLRRASSKMTNLSPSDRPIVIGISVPSDKLDQHTISPDVGPTPISVSDRQYGTSRRPSDTPTVIITPAVVTSPWSAGPSSSFKPGRRRAPSSLYSRATNARGTPKPAEIPPVPSAPRQPSSESSNAQYPEGPNTRVASAYTVFDEDDSPRQESRDRPSSGESQLRILKRSSTDSITTRHRSEGWWNHIMSPFFPKSSAVPWRSSPRIPEPVPDIPEATPPTPQEKHQDPLVHRSLPRRTKRSSSGHTSIWTDFSLHDADSEPETTKMLHSPIHDQFRGLERPEKDLSDWFNSLGAAAEYYHGCWHDQAYSTPYFECQNHVCVPRRLGNFPQPGGIREDSRGLLDEPLESQETAAPTRSQDKGLNDFQQKPANRFSAAFREAVSPKSKIRERPPSDTTVIEEVDDATPMVHEAQAAPVVRAPIPVSAAHPSPPSPMTKAEAAMSTSNSPVSPPIGSKKPPPPVTSSPLAHTPWTQSPQVLNTSKDTQTQETKEVSEGSPPKADKPAKRFVAVLPPDHPSTTRAMPMSPEGVSPAAQVYHGPNSLALGTLSREKESFSNKASNPTPHTIVNHYHYAAYAAHQDAKSDQVSLRDMEPPPRPAWSPRDMKVARAQEKGQAQKSMKGNRRCSPKLTACLNRGKPKTKKQKWLLILITSGLIIMILIILLLAMLLTRKGDSMEVQSQWLNLTGFPPIPTGISTIIQPDPVQEASGCVHPATLWSCAVPKEQQSSIAPNAPDQPNFRVEIRFQNGSLAAQGASNSTGFQRRSDLSGGNVVSAGSFIRSRLLHIRDLSNNLFTPSPAPPIREDQVFLGNTTDKNLQPFDGAATPFFISFIDSKRLPSARLIKRAPSPQTDTTANSTDPFPNLGAAIPPPSTDPDGTASPALLYPLASAQPLRLFNRDTESEHYGFYTYFDRSIFLKSAALLNFTGASPSELPDDENGGADENAAKVRCTWAQTRFLVQIWTRKGNTAPLLQSSNSSSNSAPNSHPKNLTESSANNFTRPGSFPYPVSITLDRHGGDIKKKMIYCYGLDQQEHIISDEKQIQLEDRAFGGVLVNPAQGPFGQVNVTGDDGGPGGIDGGSGGCGCRWENFSGGR